MKVDLSKIDPKAEREVKSIHDLQLLYENNICPSINRTALLLFNKRELKRHLAIAIYREGVKHKTRNRYWVIQRVCWLLGLSKRTVEGYCPSNRTKTAQKQQ